MIRPFPKLKKGDTIGVAAPSARFDKEKLYQGIAALESQGFRVRVPRDIFLTNRYLAGEDRKRAQVLNTLFSDPDIKGIIAARGGYGAMRTLPFMDWKAVRNSPKCVVGFSDATALLNALVQRGGIQAVHGPNLVSLASADATTLASFGGAVRGEPQVIDAVNGVPIRPGKAEGILLGGNMATLAHLMGTPFQPDFSGSVLFLEDVGEPAYKIDRMLSQMKMAGLFHNVSGVITGSFDRCPGNEYIPEILLDIFDRDQVPVLMGTDCGHGPVNLSLTLGAKVFLDGSNRKIQWL